MFWESSDLVSLASVGCVYEAGRGDSAILILRWDVMSIGRKDSQRWAAWTYGGGGGGHNEGVFLLCLDGRPGTSPSQACSLWLSSLLPSLPDFWALWCCPCHSHLSWGKEVLLVARCFCFQHQLAGPLQSGRSISPCSCGQSGILGFCPNRFLLPTWEVNED